MTVALRKESVDRNNGVHYDNYNLHWSLSARRAWIEIIIQQQKKETTRVALRKESVDRNGIVVHRLALLMMSLSARRAWIEMANYCERAGMMKGRSPQGERG